MKLNKELQDLKTSTVSLEKYAEELLDGLNICNNKINDYKIKLNKSLTNLE